MAGDGLPELSRELSRLAAEIAGDGDCGADTIDEAVRVLRALRGLVSSGQDEEPPSDEATAAAVPQEFLCPISKRLMHEPVVLATGQTYDRSNIEELLNKGDRRCPKTQKPLLHSVLTPNNLIRELISRWFKDRGIELPKLAADAPDNAVIEPKREDFQLLLEKFSASSPLEDQKVAAKELRKLSKRVQSFQAFSIESSSKIRELMNAANHPELQEDLVTTVLHLSVNKENRKVMEEDPFVITFLIVSMEYGSLKSRGNAAAALRVLLSPDSSKRLSGKLGALDPLIRLIKEAEPLALNDVVSAISSLCSIAEYKARAVREGVVGAILSKMTSFAPTDELISLLAYFSTDQDALDKMGELEAVSCLLGILKEIDNEQSKEHCVSILYAIAYRDSRKLREMRRDEKDNGTLSAVAESQASTSRAKRKANGILDKIRRTYGETHTG